MSSDPVNRPKVPAGLCAVCANAVPVTSARGSVFILCRLASSDPRYPKYPALPVTACEGFEQK
jgi:hypothetical protein